MRGLMIAAATIGLLVSAGSAMAAQEAQGTISQVNPATGTLTLQNGQTYTFSNPTVLIGFIPGENIGVTYTGNNQGIGAFDPDRAN
ncbi:DUF1344 domain-containing protein [Mesorhizobium sp. BR1-1-16]|uniref:DUF1344 domain-containing protein n=1 Tax=Mesorhizobium sp. BR1-1-16 TaxID=2876653 RepID=UPI001CCD4B29|nr:DUF1344 domain-containing protein [Mesorhizobium sp. BR1-1-16]MBZ9934764.1 DUF1344 domain-containing protein [Mesorhizobium sp. BR1-1-16]